VFMRITDSVRIFRKKFNNLVCKALINDAKKRQIKQKLRIKAEEKYKNRRTNIFRQAVSICLILISLIVSYFGYFNECNAGEGLKVVKSGKAGMVRCRFCGEINAQDNYVKISPLLYKCPCCGRLIRHK
jgi:hypothetical protein